MGHGESFEHFRKRIQRECLAFDRTRLMRAFHSLRDAQRTGRPCDERQLKLEIDIEESCARLAARKDKLPQPTYADNLPVCQRREEIRNAIRDHQVIVLCGETGSGKTTQIPKICLELGRGVSGLIGHTQPRRVAARSVARRIAEELKTSLGELVGYKVRFLDHTRHEGYIKLMTDGILLAETQGDRLLQQYDTIIIDEAHERSLNIDFLLGYLKQILPKRPDLKIIIMSATIDPERFSKHFDNAPIVEVSGRTFPVEYRYRPVLDQTNEDAVDRDRTMQEAILDAVDELTQGDIRADGAEGSRSTGDILIFLSGEREIRETAESLRKHHPPETEILPMFARLSASEQDKVFKSHRGRRIVLATNVAETSLTVPGVRYVIDPGFARMSRYSRHTKVQRLPIEPISQASANQRAGRCGRVASGICVRLYSETDFVARDEFTDPEIVRSNLAGVILQMKSLRLGKVEQFPFIEPPDGRLIRDGYQTLYELGAIDEQDSLTPVGQALARLPVDPRIGRMLFAASSEKCLSEILIIASALSIQDPRERPMDHADAADQSHAEFRDTQSDFLAYVNMWEFYHEQVRHLSRSKLRKLCKKRFLSYLRMREWEDIYKQLKTLMRELGHQLNEKPAEYDNIHKALLTGLLSNIGFRKEKYEYTGARGTKFNIFPGSSQFSERPRWVTSAELVRTTKLYARTVARIKPEWIEDVAPHLIKKSYNNEQWSEQSAHVTAIERVSLWGLPVVETRRVHYGPIAPIESRRLFIHHALVLDEYRTKAKWAKNNRKMVEQALDLRDRTRRHDLLYDDSLRFDFFDRIVPAGIYNGPLFEKWRREAESEDHRLLHMSLADVLGEDPDADVAHLYPDHFVAHGSTFRLRYHYEPGAITDGVTVTIPVEALSSLSNHVFEWIIPGYLNEKVRFLIRSLPKGYRTAFQPASDFAEAFIDQNTNVPDHALTKAIVDFAKQRMGVAIPIDAFRTDELPDYLLMRFRVVDRKGKPLAAGRDLEKIRHTLQPEIAKALNRISDSVYNRDGVRKWDFGDLPESIEVKRRSMLVRAYPAIVDQEKAVALRLFQSCGEAESHMRSGLRRLAMLELGRDLTAQAKNLPHLGEMSIHFTTLGPSSELRTELIECIADRAFFGEFDGRPNDWIVRNKKEFDRRLVIAGRRVYPTVSEVCGLSRRILKAYHMVDAKLNDHFPESCDTAIKDIEIQLGHLVRKRFLVNTPWKWLEQYPRYLSGMHHRLSKLARSEFGKDSENTTRVRPFWYACLDVMEQMKKAGKPLPREWVEYRFLVEEFRISIFAQQLGTVVPISAKRLKQKWHQLNQAP